MNTQHLPLTFERRLKHERAEYLIDLVFSSAAKVKAIFGAHNARKPGRPRAAV